MNQNKNIKENLQDAVSLLLLLENDLSQQREDEVYQRTVKIIHKIITSAITELEEQ